MFRTLLWQISRWASEPVPHANDMQVNDPAHPDVAVCAIATGASYLDMSMTMIRSVRNRGGFNGPVYVFTDRPENFGSMEKVFPISVPEPAGSMGAKQYKTFMNACIPYDYILYIDVDIVVGKPLGPWIKKAKEAALSHSLVLFWDTASVGHFYHSGVILVKRDVSPDFMRRWRRKIWFGRVNRDQKALIRSVRRDKDVYVMPPEDMIFLGKTGASLDTIGIFNHMPGRARQIVSPDKITAFLRHLGL